MAKPIYRNNLRVNVPSAETSSSARKHILAKDICWANLILVMENEHKRAITLRV